MVEPLLEQQEDHKRTIEEGWIHPHELARGAIGYEVEMEEPASCFYHPKTMNGKCKLPDVLKLIEEWV